MRTCSSLVAVVWVAAGLSSAAVAQDPTPAGAATEPSSAPIAQEPPAVASVVLEPGFDRAAIAQPGAISGADGSSAYGMYLSGRVASVRGDRIAGAELLTGTQALFPDQPAVADEAFRAALFSGDIESVVRLSGGVSDNALLADAGRLFAIAQALKTGQGAEARGLAERGPFAEPYTSIARSLEAVTLAAAGDWEAALAPIPAETTGLAAVVLGLQRARLLELRGRSAEAEAQYQSLLETQPAAAVFFRTLYGGFLERAGRRNDARAVYEQALAGSAPDSQAFAALKRMEARGRPPARAGLAEIAAQNFFFAALEVQLILASSPEGRSELPAIYLQLAHYLSPTDSLKVSLGQSLIDAGQPGLAQAVLEQVGRADAIAYARAQTSLAVALQGEDRDEAALEALRRADAAAPDQAAVSASLARQLIDMERHAEALDVLNRPSLNTAEQGVETRFLRGLVLERLGRLDEAEAELWAALQAAPDNPLLLNHLGYFWVDSGRRVEQGTEMLERAHAAQPDNGNIQDSLGWARYRQGRYVEAVETLEQAVDKEPANAEINDHLGDAYWRVGRRREAEWQWSRVLTLDPEPERRAEVERKLAAGLPAADQPAPAGEGSAWR